MIISKQPFDGLLSALLRKNTELFKENSKQKLHSQMAKSKAQTHQTNG